MMKNKATVLFLLAVLASPLAQGFNFHMPDSQSISDWQTGTYEDRVKIDRQWEYERRVIDLENERRSDLERQRRDDTWNEVNADRYDGWDSL